MKAKNRKQFSSLWNWSILFFWRRQAVYGLILSFLLGLIIIQLSIIPGQFASIEYDYSSQNQNFSSIGENPLSLPHKLATYSVTKFSHSIRAVRAVSIVFYGLCVVALYRILKRWHSDKIALFATVMFATNSTTLATGRLATPLVLIFGWSIVVSLLLWLQHGNSYKVAPFALLVISAILLYLPGAPYFFVLLFILFGSKLIVTVKTLKKSTVNIAIIASLFVLAPLVLGFIGDINILKQWFLLPPKLNITDILNNILQVPSAFIYRSPINPILNTGRLPVLDVAGGGLLLIGLYAYQKNIKLERTRIMVLTALFGTIIGALGEVAIAIILLLPFAYSVVAAGISYVLDEWYAVFPKNPFAKSFGLLLVTFVVLMSVYYQITRFLVVWPQTPETRSVYSQSNLIQ